jgi:hypothetical protein
LLDLRGDHARQQKQCRDERKQEKEGSDTHNKAREISLKVDTGAECCTIAPGVSVFVLCGPGGQAC